MLSKARPQWLFLFAVVLFCSSVFLWISANQRAQAQSSSEQSLMFSVLQRGTIRVGVTSEAPPMGFIDNSGNLVGFDIDIAHILAKALFNDPAKVDLVKLSFPSRWQAVNEGKVDAGIMSTTIWPDRLPRVNFTLPYLRAGQGVLAKTAITSIKSLDDPRYTVAILNTPSEFDFMKQLMPRAKQLVLSSTGDKITALRTGRAQAIMVDRPLLAWEVKNIPGVHFLGAIGPGSDDAIFLKQNDFQWWWYLNAFVYELRCGSLYEDYSKAYVKWFKVEPPDQSTCLAFSRADFAKSATMR